jgi:signal transduction histidine kinase/CheY-like chemotaxis protein
MFTNELVFFGITIVLLMVLFFIVLKVVKLKDIKEINSLEDEIYQLKAKVLDQEKIIKFSKNGVQSHSALEQIKKIETLEIEIIKQKKRVENAKLIAQEAHKVKSKFLSNIKNEIRTPIKAITLFSDLLLEEVQNTKLKTYAKKVYLSGTKLLEMIDTIIELSCVEKGTFTLVEKPVDIKALVQEVIKSQRDEVARKDLELTLDIDDILPDSLMLDKEKVEEIFRNLIENAVKFTEKGFVHVKLVENGKDIVKNSINVAFIVEDSGIGISEENQNKIFDIFESSEKGMSLGLSINKRVAEQMNGDIFLESDLSKGSKFVFSISSVEIVLQNDYLQEFNTNTIDFSLIRPTGGSLLVIDESIELRNLVRESFFETTLKILSFDNPRDAIETLTKNQVDMILIDIDMLISDDNAVSKILQGISNAPVVTLTDKRIKDVDLQSSASQIVGHLKKPLSKSELFKISLEVLNKK